HWCRTDTSLKKIQVGRLRILVHRLFHCRVHEIIVERPGQRIQPLPIVSDGLENDSTAMPADTDLIGVEPEFHGEPDCLRPTGPEYFRGFHASLGMMKIYQ